MPMWNPWRGCKKCSEGCLHCYIHKGDAKRGVDTSMIVKTKDFEKPVAQLKKGGYKMKPGLVYLGFSTDFLIEDAEKPDAVIARFVAQGLSPEETADRIGIPLDFVVSSLNVAKYAERKTGRQI